MSGRNLARALPVCATVCLILVRISLGRVADWRRSLIKDITGGAALIFRAPKGSCGPYCQRGPECGGWWEDKGQETTATKTGLIETVTQ